MFIFTKQTFNSDEGASKGDGYMQEARRKDDAMHMHMHMHITRGAHNYFLDEIDLDVSAAQRCYHLWFLANCQCSFQLNDSTSFELLPLSIVQAVHSFKY